MPASRIVPRCVAAVAFAASASAAAPAPRPARPLSEAALPPAQGALTVSPEPGGAFWRFRIENKSSGPVRIPAPPHLLSFELPPPAPAAEPDTKKKAPAPPRPLRCVLPDDARPSTDDERE